jgi:hypothetical protein
LVRANRRLGGSRESTPTEPLLSWSSPAAGSPSVLIGLIVEAHEAKRQVAPLCAMALNRTICCCPVGGIVRLIEIDRGDPRPSSVTTPVPLDHPLRRRLTQPEQVHCPRPVLEPAGGRLWQLAADSGHRRCARGGGKATRALHSEVMRCGVLCGRGEDAGHPAGSAHPTPAAVGCRVRDLRPPDRGTQHALLPHVTLVFRCFCAIHLTVTEALARAWRKPVRRCACKARRRATSAAIHSTLAERESAARRAPWATTGGLGTPAYIVGMERSPSLTSFSDDELLRRLADTLGHSRRNEADLVAHIGEFDRRRLYARSAAPSMFAYCTDLLHLSEAEAYLRIAAARASREHPRLLTLLSDGRLHLTAIATLAPHLTPENCEGLLDRAVHRSKRAIEELVAEVSPRPDAPALTRRLPERRGTTTTSSAVRPGPHAAGPSVGPSPMEDAPARLQLRPDGVAPLEPVPATPPASHGRRRATVEPLATARYKVQFTASAEFHDELERLRALMRPSVPDGDLAAIIERAVTEKLQKLEARRFARTQAPRTGPSESDTSPRTRRIPAAVKRAVYDRDGGRCRYEDGQGRRCPAREGLEFHHRHPYGHGGDHSLANIALMCRAHNRHLAEVDYGREAIDRHRRSATSLSEPKPHLSP